MSILVTGWIEKRILAFAGLRICAAANVADVEIR
jgi:hypothetical protein